MPKWVFFADMDTGQPINEGQTVQFEREQRGKFWNGKNLHPIISPPITPSNGNIQAVIASINNKDKDFARPALHEMSVEELRALYHKIEANHGELALLG